MAPEKKWRVIANGFQTKEPETLFESKKIFAASGFKDMFDRHDDGCDDKAWMLWDFKVTTNISTYLYNLCAGDYEVIENKRDD